MPTLGEAVAVFIADADLATEFRSVYLVTPEGRLVTPDGKLIA